VIGALKDRGRALTATVYAEGVPELRGDLLVLTYPVESDFYAKEGRKLRHLHALEDVVEDFIGVRPRIELKVKQGERRQPL
jgi:hypothetical protein